MYEKHYRNKVLIKWLIDWKCMKATGKKGKFKYDRIRHYSTFRVMRKSCWGPQQGLKPRPFALMESGCITLRLSAFAGAFGCFPPAPGQVCTEPGSIINGVKLWLAPSPCRPLHLRGHRCLAPPSTAASLMQTMCAFLQITLQRPISAAKPHKYAKILKGKHITLIPCFALFFLKKYHLFFLFFLFINP